MAQDLSPATQRRITLLAILPTVDGDLSAALGIFDEIENDGRFFDGGDSRPTQQASSGRRPTSGGQDSASRPSSRGRDSGKPAFTGQLRDPDGPPTEAQVGAALKLTDEYTADELWDMTKQQVSDLISDLKR